MHHSAVSTPSQESPLKPKSRLHLASEARVRQFRAQEAAIKTENSPTKLSRGIAQRAANLLKNTPSPSKTQQDILHPPASPVKPTPTTQLLNRLENAESIPFVFGSRVTRSRSASLVATGLLDMPQKVMSPGPRLRSGREVLYGPLTPRKTRVAGKKGVAEVAGTKGVEMDEVGLVKKGFDAADKLSPGSRTSGRRSETSPASLQSGLVDNSDYAGLSRQAIPSKSSKVTALPSVFSTWSSFGPGLGSRRSSQSGSTTGTERDASQKLNIDPFKKSWKVPRAPIESIPAQRNRFETSTPPESPKVEGQSSVHVSKPNDVALVQSPKKLKHVISTFGRKDDFDNRPGNYRGTFDFDAEPSLQWPSLRSDQTKHCYSPIKPRRPYRNSSRASTATTAILQDGTNEIAQATKSDAEDNSDTKSSADDRGTEVSGNEMDFSSIMGFHFPKDDANGNTKASTEGNSDNDSSTDHSVTDVGNQTIDDELEDEYILKFRFSKPETADTASKSTEASQKVEDTQMDELAESLEAMAIRYRRERHGCLVRTLEFKKNHRALCQRALAGVTRY